MIGKLFSSIIDGSLSVIEQTIKLPARVVCLSDEHEWECIDDGKKCEICGARK